ncbi:MAG: response regulator [Elusimicrobia bacterium]|nr:response regulator [Elusimicrobiota bacterium]
MANILVVDDEADMRMALGSVLSRSGHTIMQATDGPSALARIEKGDVDLVLLDIRLPGMDGVQILRKIREDRESLPVIMVTGYGSVESAVEVMKLGASQYLAKPFSNKELVDKVTTALQATGGARAAAAPGPMDEPAPPPRDPSPERTSEGGPKIVWEWVAGLAVVAVGVLVAAQAIGGPDEYPVPYQHPVSVAWKGESLWSADWFSQTVYELKQKGSRLEIARSVHIPDSHITGLAVTDDMLFVADSWKKTIQRRRLDGGFTLVDSVKSPGGNPTGLYWDGRYLWSVDSETRRFYQHDLDHQMTVVASFKAPGKTPAALFKDPQYFWSADADTRMLYQHRLDNELRVIARYTLPALDMGREALSCFTWRDRWLWVGRDGIPKLFRYKLEQFKKHPSIE